MTRHLEHINYTETGNKFLGKIPSHWDIKPNSSLIKLTKKIVGDKSSQYKLLSLTLDGVKIRDIESGKGKFPESFDTYQEVHQGDLIFCLFDMDETPRTVGLSDHSGMITGAYTVYRPTTLVNSKFVYYYFLHHDAQKSLKPFYTGLRKVIQKGVFGAIRIATPSLIEQNLIVEFIDRQTSRIDTLIYKKTKFIELLKEKRQAEITKAVTKGLHESVPLKQSSVKWLNEIPKHWSVQALKRCSSVNDDILSDETHPDHIIEYIEIGDVNEVDGIKSTTQVKFSESASRARRVVKHGDIIISTVRTYLKAITPIINPKPNLVVSTGFAVVRPISIDSRFARYALSADYFLTMVVARSTGISYPAINASDLMTLHIAVPPKTEQLEIASYLEKSLSRIDQLTKKTERSICILQEHRCALITAAVTGKIDVRETK